MLSPKLFTEFLQVISKSFDQGEGIPVVYFIDCILVICRRPCPFSDSANGLQKQLTALYKYASLWHIIVSIPKTKVIMLTNAIRQNVTASTMVMT